MQENRWKAVGITWGIALALLLLSMFALFTGADDMSMFLSSISTLAMFVGGIFLDMAIAWEFSEIAEKKGHYDRRYWWLAFCLTMIGYLIVIALPDRGAAVPRTSAPKSAAQPQPTYGAPQQTYGAPQQTYGAPQQTYGTPQQTYGAPQQSYNDLPDL